MGFDKRELRLKADWTRLTMYRGFIYAAPIGGKAPLSCASETGWSRGATR